MKDYKEFTFGWLIFVFVVPIHLLLTYLHMNTIGDTPIEANGYLVITLTLILVCLLFYGLTTKITSNSILVLFGIGLIRKRIKLNRIKAVETVKSPWYYGWGIRIIPNGTLYNISGTDAVELKFNDTDRIIRIGTKDPLTLRKEIEKRLI
jgi:hypothetical protein